MIHVYASNCRYDHVDVLRSGIPTYTVPRALLKNVCRRPCTFRAGRKAHTTVFVRDNVDHVAYIYIMLTPKHTAGCVYQTAYHLVWRPVYRRDVLGEPIKSRLESLFHEIAHNKGFDILAVDVQPDHVHLFVSLPPAMSIATAVQLLKSISARKLRLEFPHLRRHTRSDRLWAPSYYVGTAGNVSAETIRHSIEECQGDIDCQSPHRTE